jgi:hypothetical protein
VEPAGFPRHRLRALGRSYFASWTAQLASCWAPPFAGYVLHTGVLDQRCDLVCCVLTTHNIAMSVAHRNSPSSNSSSSSRQLLSSRLTVAHVTSFWSLTLTHPLGSLSHCSLYC